LYSVVDPGNWTVFDRQRTVQKGESTDGKTSNFQTGIQGPRRPPGSDWNEDRPQVCRERQLSEQLLAAWKKQLLAHADLVFAQEREVTADQARLAELEQMVGRLTMELEAAKTVVRAGVIKRRQLLVKV
jgi:hypothetical protein